MNHKKVFVLFYLMFLTITSFLIFKTLCNDWQEIFLVHFLNLQTVQKDLLRKILLGQTMKKLKFTILNYKSDNFFRHGR